MANKKSELYTIHLDYGESIMLIFRFLLNCQIVQMRGRLKSVYSVYLKWLDVVVEILKQLVLKRRISIEPNFRLCWHAVDCVLLIHPTRKFSFTIKQFESFRHIILQTFEAMLLLGFFVNYLQLESNLDHSNRSLSPHPPCRFTLNIGGLRLKQI